MSRDLSSGLPVEREQVVAECPDVPFWSENLLFAMYDGKNDLGMWFHLGTVPGDWTMWEDRVFVALPGDEGTLAMWSHHRSPPERRPGGPNLAFKCIEPFKRWQVTFDGFAQHVTNEAMVNGLAGDGRRRMVVDLDVECITPVWDAHKTDGEAGHHGKGSMENQGWAKEHYEQLYRATGTVKIDDKTYEVEAAGWRDHSRGPRDGGTGDPWGGHMIVGALFPSGRGLIFSSYWKTDGRVNLEDGIAVDAQGKFSHVDIKALPRLKDLQLTGEKVPVELTWEGGSAKFDLDCQKSTWIAMKKRVKVAKDLSGTGLMYVLNYGPCELDGEVGLFYMERSDHLNALPEKVG